MDLLVFVLIAVLVGWLVYLLTTRVPMPSFWRTAIQVLALVVIVVWLLRRLGVWPTFF